MVYHAHGQTNQPMQYQQGLTGIQNPGFNQPFYQGTQQFQGQAIANQYPPPYNQKPEFMNENIPPKRALNPYVQDPSTGQIQHDPHRENAGEQHDPYRGYPNPHQNPYITTMHYESANPPPYEAPKPNVYETPITTKPSSSHSRQGSNEYETIDHTKGDANVYEDLK